MTRLRTPAAVLLATAFAVLPATTTPAYADTIRARQQTAETPTRSTRDQGTPGSPAGSWARATAARTRTEPETRTYWMEGAAGSPPF
ncbi:hypothetical protein ACWCQ0_43605 [Streptomyces massasporeus]